MYQLQGLTAGDGSEVRVIDTVADKDWSRMAIALGFDESTRTDIALLASDEPDSACADMFERWLKGGGGLKPATWGILTRCLKHSGYKSLARKVNEFILHQV